MNWSVIITSAYLGGLLMAVFAHTFKLGAVANRHLLFTIVFILAILTIGA